MKPIMQQLANLFLPNQQQLKSSNEQLYRGEIITTVRNFFDYSKS
jgi:hypothetical protein